MARHVHKRTIPLINVMRQRILDAIVLAIFSVLYSFAVFLLRFRPAAAARRSATA